MRKTSGSPHRSLRDRIAILCGALIAALFASCSSGGRNRDGYELPPPSPKILQRHAANIRAYRDALILFGSPNPVDWDSAHEKLKALGTMFIWDDDLKLIRETRTGQDPAQARARLAERGWLLDGIIVFSGKYDAALWRETHRRVMEELGEAARVHFITALFKMLINQQLMHQVIHYRTYLIESGDVARDTAVALAKAMADQMSTGPLAKIRDLTEVSAVVLGFGDQTRGKVQELLAHPNVNARRAVLAGIGESRDVSHAETVQKLLIEDPEWQVRIAAAQTLGLMKTVSDQSGPVLLEALKTEKDSLVRKAIVLALGESRYPEAVPVLINTLDFPEPETVEKVMEALWLITGKRLTRKGQWIAWYNREYRAWLQKVRGGSR